MFWTIFYIALAVLVVFGILPTLVMSFVIYYILLVRNKPEKWGRTCSFPDDEEYARMFEQALEWGKANASFKTEVDIVSAGYHLYGEYFDFGHKKAVIIVSGRTESLLYSYYFAEPYKQSGYNVLVIDNRCHGNSEGKYSALGQKEYVDLLAWSKLLHDKYANESIIFHGVCIGSAASLFALTDKNAPDYLAGMVAEGMYTTFHESFKNHMRVDHHPQFPFTLEVMLHIRVFSGVNVLTNGPIKRIKKLDKPILFLHSKEDEFSLPEKAEILYNSCPAHKKIVWFSKGAHSRIRINNQSKYDSSIMEFLKNDVKSV